MDGVEINGEIIPVRECARLLRMMYKDAQQVAGEFHTLNRSAKFRLNWPNEYEFAESEWRNFIDATRQMYTEQLSDPQVHADKKDKMFKAIVLERKISEGMEKDNRLQLYPNSQQFVGDKKENKNILEKFGAVPNLRAYLRRSTSIH